MVGAILISSSSFADLYSCPYLFSDSLSLSNLNVKSSGDSGLYRNLIARKQLWRPGSLALSSSFIDAWYEWRLSTKMLSHIANQCYRKQRKLGNHLRIVDELGGQYEDSFIDVKKASKLLRNLPVFDISNIVMFFMIVVLLITNFLLWKDQYMTCHS